MLAAVTAAIAISILLPIIGGAVMLLGLITLRAGDLTGSRLARRRARQGRRGGGALVGMVFFPVALARSVLRFALLAPLGLVLAAAVAAITIVTVPVHPLPRATACAAGALIAFYGLGPGSGAARRPLAAILGRATRAPATAAMTYIVVIAAAMALAVAAVRQGPVFWPGGNLSGHVAGMPGVHGMLNGIRRALLSLASRLGL